MRGRECVRVQRRESYGKRGRVGGRQWKKRQQDMITVKAEKQNCSYGFG